jgi:hypothetical protein
MRLDDRAAEGYDLQLTRYDGRGWRETFYTTGMEHSPTDNARWQMMLADDVVWELPFAPALGHPARVSGRAEVVQFAA